MKKKKARGNSLTRSWREIRQTANRKVVTAHARKRILRSTMRAFLAVTTVILMAAGTYFGVSHWQQGMQKVNTVLPTQPLREIVFRTDGVLSKSWLENLLGLPENVEIMSIDIHQKKLLLEQHGQIRSAVIRRLPEQLVIEVQERRPVVRVATHDEYGQVIGLLVDRDGHVYPGSGYDRHEISTLPFLGGVALQRDGHGFRRLSGIDRIDDLLRTARSHSPHLYESWLVVDSSEPPLLKVRSREIREIVFGPGRYTEQLQWLDMIIENNRRQMLRMEERIDLSLGSHVVVR